MYVDKLRGVGQIVDEANQLVNLLKGLTPEYEMIQITLLNQPDLTYATACNRFVGFRDR